MSPAIDGHLSNAMVWLLFSPISVKTIVKGLPSTS
jgi:hypothetical protein